MDGTLGENDDQDLDDSNIDEARSQQYRTDSVYVKDVDSI